MTAHNRFPIRGSHGELYYVDLFTKLLDERIIFLGMGIASDQGGRTVLTDSLADYISGAMLYLQSENPELDIQLYINSPGGSLSAALAIYDTMQYLTCDVQTICLGTAASGAALLLAAGAAGKRFALPHSKIIIHQPWTSGIGGQVTDIKIHTEDLLKDRERLNRILAKHTGQPVEKIQEDTERDYIMSPEEAKDYGIIDEIITYSKEIAKRQKQ